MGISLTASAASLAVQRHLDESGQDLARAMERLASGRRITRAADDAAGLSLSETLESQIRSVQQAHRNTLDALSLAQVAEGGMNEVSNILIRLRELTIQAASDSVGDTERALLDIEAQELKRELERLAESTRYLGTPLLNGEGREFVFQIGPENNEFHRLSYDAAAIDLRPDALGVDDLELTDRDEALDSLESLDEAVARLGDPRARLGALQTRMHSITRQLLNMEEGLVSGQSRILDADMGREAMEMVRAQVRQRAGVAVLTQANLLPTLALRLLE